MPRNSETAHVLDAQDLGALGRALGFAVLLLDGKGRVRDARGDAEQILGRPLARMRGRPLASFIAKSDRYLLDDCLDGRRRDFVPLRLAGRGGAPRWIEMRGSRLGGNRPAHGVLIATHDITDETGRRTRAACGRAASACRLERASARGPQPARGRRRLHAARAAGDHADVGERHRQGECGGRRPRLGGQGHALTGLRAGSRQ